MNAIEVRNISKKYIIHHERPTLTRDFFMRPFYGRKNREEFWALKDVSFDVKKGETIGIIGENGAGKSTLLKILTGVARPTSGSVEINGRVGALLELGAGFHPDLTGRENIYLNGSILGLSKRGIDRRFDEIVEFSGIKDFIDTPIRTYSSGMFVRLGFSVAVHMEPDILLIDEVLAVGDIAFQQKCMEKLFEFKRNGKTMLFITHNLGYIKMISSKGLFIDEGVIKSWGKIDEVINTYLKQIQDKKLDSADTARKDLSDTPSKIKITNVKIYDKDGKKRRHYTTGEEMYVEINYVATKEVINPVFRVQIYRDDGLFCHGTNTDRDGLDLGRVIGEGKIILRCTKITLLKGNYFLNPAILPYDIHGMRYKISIDSSSKDGGGIVTMYTDWLLEKAVTSTNKSARVVK